MGGNIIDYKPYMECEYKIYVEVNEDRQADGQVLPRSFVWEDGSRYEIDRVKDVRPAASLKAGGVGLRYTVMVRNRETYMFLEEDGCVSRWFMERKKAR
jgi:hypothetical protein